MNAGDPGKMNMQPTLPEEEDGEDEEMGVAETYADYMPTKRKKIFNQSSFLAHLIRTNAQFCGSKKKFSLL